VRDNTVAYLVCGKDPGNYNLAHWLFSLQATPENNAPWGKNPSFLTCLQNPNSARRHSQPDPYKTKKPMNPNAITQLKSESTWKLFGLTLITYFVYAAHYIKRQTKIINENYDGTDKISDGFITFIMVISYLSLFFFIGYLFVDESHVIAMISNIIDPISSVVYIVWGFKARNRMNIILSAKKKTPSWFHGLWTFLFTPLYFNFKVNKLNEELEGQTF
jgi:hypothetical protein